MPDHLIVYWMNIHIPMWPGPGRYVDHLQGSYQNQHGLERAIHRCAYAEIWYKQCIYNNVYIYIYYTHTHVQYIYIIFIHTCLYIYRHTVYVHWINQRMSSNNGWKSMSTHIHMNSTPDWNLKVDSSLRKGISFCAVLVDPVSTGQTTSGTCF